MSEIQMQNVVIKTFKTPLGYYVYDRETNSLLSVDEGAYYAFERIASGNDTEEDRKILSQYQKKGFCNETGLKEIRNNHVDVIDYHLKNKVKKITLQVTQNCNLRCGYCSYSGKYEQRTHTNNKMSFELMKKSVDFLMEHSVDVLEPVNIGFYGGEPLLEFENIKKIIAYIGEEYPDKQIVYSMTTNGTLLNDSVLEFLTDHTFNIMISLDGPKEIHNQQRVFADGRGSFDTVMNNIRHVKEQYPKIFSSLSFNTVIAPESDYKCVHDFFNAKDVFEEDNSMSFGVVNPYNSKDSIRYDDKYYISSNYENVKILFSKLGIYNPDKTSKMLRSSFNKIRLFHDKLGKSVKMSHRGHPGGPCIPGVLRPFVDVNGNIFPCERVSEASNVMKIGHIDTGYEVEKIKKLLNIGEVTADECKKCWNFIHCGICGAAMDDLNELSRDKKLRECGWQKMDTLNKMKTICLLKEYNYDFKEG